MTLAAAREAQSRDSGSANTARAGPVRDGDLYRRSKVILDSVGMSSEASATSQREEVTRRATRRSQRGRGGVANWRRGDESTRRVDPFESMCDSADSICLHRVFAGRAREAAAGGRRACDRSAGGEATAAGSAFPGDCFDEQLRQGRADKSAM